MLYILAFVVLCLLAGWYILKTVVGGKKASAVDVDSPLEHFMLAPRPAPLTAEELINCFKAAGEEAGRVLESHRQALRNSTDRETLQNLLKKFDTTVGVNHAIAVYYKAVTLNAGLPTNKDNMTRAIKAALLDG